MQVSVDGAELYVEVTGSGPPVLSVSGSGQALSELSNLLMAPLAAGFTVASYDHRGLGRSVSEDAPLTMAEFAADGFAVADALGWDRFSLVGISFGGMVALEMAVGSPDRIQGLAVACTSSGGEGGSSYPLHERPDPEQALALLDSRPEVALELAKALAGQQVPNEPGYERQLQARRHHDVWSRLPSITAPTLVTSGRYDALAPPENGRAIAGAIPGAVFDLFDGGHAFLFQDPRAWPVVIDFLTAHS